MSINFHIKTKDFDLTPDVTNYIHEKLGVLEKFISDDKDKEILAEVEVGLRSRHHRKGNIFRAEINLSYDGKKYYAVTKASDIFAAIDELKDEISKSVKRSENKKENIFRRSERAFKRLLQGRR